MASEHFKVKNCWKSDKPKQTEKDVKCNPREYESMMKFSSKHIASPPPKPPRRRYSDQLPVSSLGSWSNRKHNEENVKIEPKLKALDPEPAYLSLPANLSSKQYLSQSFSLFDQLKESDTGNAEIRCGSGENFQEMDSFKYAPYSLDKFSVFLTYKCPSKNFESCHRRHNSDPVISHFNLQNGDSSHVDQGNKLCKYNESCACCEKTNLFTKEIRILKETNEKLWQHLCSLLSYVENMRKRAFDDCSDISISGLLSSVYYAQKARDRAMEERLRIGLEERDRALHEYDDLLHFMAKSFDYADEEKAEKDIHELVADIENSCNPSKLLQNQRMLLTQIYKLKGLKQGSLSQQLKQVEMERDSALDKVRKLEEEVKDLKLSYDIWHCDNKNWEFSIIDILSQLLHQRDSVLSKIDNGLDLGNIIHWPLKGSKFESLESQNPSQFESIKHHYRSDYKLKHSFGASDQVSKLKEEIFLLNKAFESEMRKRELAEAKCIKLERLTHILRKKLNGQNIGVPV